MGSGSNEGAEGSRNKLDIFNHFNVQQTFNFEDCLLLAMAHEYRDRNKESPKEPTGAVFALRLSQITARHGATFVTVVGCIRIGIEFIVPFWRLPGAPLPKPNELRV